MSCISDGNLRARWDGELSPAESQDVEKHLESCAACRERADGLGRQAERVRDVLATLAPLPSEPPIDPAMALARLRANAAEPAEARSWLARLFSPRWRAAWAAAPLVALVVSLFTLAPARTWAQRILAMLRVQKIAVVSIDPVVLERNSGTDRAAKMIGQLISDDVVVTQSPGEPQHAADAGQASSLAGFRVRLLGARTDSPEIKVRGTQAMHMTVNRDRLQAILEEAGRSDVQLPSSLDGATISVSIPPVVVARYGDCPEPPHPDHGGTPGGAAKPSSQPAPELGVDCVVLVQAPSPTLSVPPNLNLAEVAQAGLQLAGMSAQEAQGFCQTVDWTTTLVVPVPSRGAAYQAAQVDGVPATLISRDPKGERGRWSGPPYTLLWVKNGIIYSLIGGGDAGQAVPLAESLE